MTRLMGFGTRNVTDNIIRPFVSNAGGKFHEKLEQEILIITILTTPTFTEQTLTNTIPF